MNPTTVQAILALTPELIDLIKAIIALFGDHSAALNAAHTVVQAHPLIVGASPEVKQALSTLTAGLVAEHQQSWRASKSPA